MTLSNYQPLPYPTDFKDFKDFNVYARALVYAIENRDQQTSNAVNGLTSSSYLVGQQTWTPVLNGITTPGTFTYTKQVGWAFRQGNIVDAWADVQWTSPGAATGNLFVNLPYKVVFSDHTPFVGVVQSSIITYTGGTGIVINAIPNTSRGEFWNVGSAFTTANQAVTATGRLIFHIRYIGESVV